MQKIIVSDVSVKTGTGEKGPWTSTQITDEKGAKYSTFDTALSHVTKGTVLEIEPEVKGKYINIKEWKILEEAKVEPSKQGEPVEDLRKQASIETQVAVKLIFEAYLKMAELISVKGGAIDGRLVGLFSRALDWCDPRIPAGKPSGDARLPKTEAKPLESHPGGPPFKDAGQFWTVATKRWGKSQSDLVTILEVKGVKDTVDFDWAWRTLETKCGEGKK